MPVGQFVAEQDTDQLVEPDRPIKPENPPGWDFFVHVEERAMPCDDVVKVGVDQRAIEVEKNGGLWSLLIVRNLSV